MLTVESGDTVVVHTRDVSDNQITPDRRPRDIDRLDWDRVYPLAGPIAVEGAEPGDTLAVEVLDLHTRGLGLDRDPARARAARRTTSPTPTCASSTSPTATFARLEAAAIPLDPFLGTMGVCPAGARAQPVMPPGTFGGNMDTRQLNQGTTLYLPVQVAGALFSTGDAHGVPGRRRGLRDRAGGADVREPALHAREGPHDPGAAVPHGRAAPAPVGAALRHHRRRRRPLRGRPGRRARDGRAHRRAPTGSRPEDAYLLASLCVDLRISEIVDAGQYIVSALLPEVVFLGAAD